MILVDFASLSGPLRGHTNEDAISITSGSTSDSDSALGASEPWSQTSTQFYRNQASTVSSISLTSDDGSKPYECLSGARTTCPNGSRIESWVASQGSEQLISAPAVPDAQRQHPRRTAPPSATSGCIQRSLPCSLTRQDERAEGFVALLVVFTAGLVEAIWPLSASPKRTDSRFYGGGVLPLRTFIQETLRRSKTSYSTLQVALYYLILLKQHLPKTDFTQEQTEGEECRAMQCGRRMFLAALILASKYLQDRNYSTRAWSKISGLRSVEINQNEIQYLNAINWKLHLRKEVFDRWSRIVLRLSALPPKDAEAVDPGWHANLANRIGWQHLITKLTPDLPEDFSQYELDGGLLTPPESPPFGPFESNGRDDDQGSPDGSGSTVVHRLPSPADSVSRPANSTAQIMPPPLPRLHNLPTPQTTPCSRFATTPAVSALKSYPRCSASSTAISNGRRECMARANLDRCPPPQPLAQARPGVCPYNRTQTLRRVSPTRSATSLTSSPESMVSDNTQSSTRSRSSSISSVASVEYLQGLRLESVSSLRCGPSREDGCDSRRISPLSRKSSDMNLHDELMSTICTKQPGDMMDWTATSQEPRPIKPIAVFDTSSQISPQLLNSISAQRKSLTEIEAAELLCNLERDLSRPTTALNHRDDNSESTPRASEAKLNVVSAESTPSTSSKSHKRSHSKTNEAMLANVRKNLLATTLTKTIRHVPGVSQVIILDTPPGSPIMVVSDSPSMKASQSPTKHWAEIKMPVPIRGKDKRLCKTDDGFRDVAKQASDLLRPSVVPAGGRYWGRGGRV